jgi:hypothetical protein
MSERRWLRGILGGIASIVTTGAVSFPLLFAVGPFTVFNDDLQSPKLTAVWNVLEPAPLMMSDPLTFLVAFALLGAAQGAAFVVVVGGLPSTVARRGLTFGFVVWLLSNLSFEVLGPFNLLAEPVPLVLVELAVALPGALAGGLVLSAIYGRHQA